MTLKASVFKPTLQTTARIHASGVRLIDKNEPLPTGQVNDDVSTLSLNTEVVIHKFCLAASILLR
ncbi:hypothetical protein GcM1_136009 [Golovinomyces cichoracearum]|uniref:Uncharacterized protein n=1 Tax=Golovinomyces cichoracearum TaxID=62708 RepID=A0A420JBM1_9PEZI|nr:hypothetical protein GcM1_136009 [Golovinomyces cichoracearum]